MTRILLNADAPDLTLETVDATSAEPFEVVAARYQAVIPADHLGPLPVLAEGLRVAFLTTDFASFERLRRTDLPGDLLFKPSAVARLDLLRAGRPTLVTTRALKAGEALSQADIAETVGGAGVGAELRDQMIGRTALYDMAAGAPVDFGYLSEDQADAKRRGEVL